MTWFQPLQNMQFPIGLGEFAAVRKHHTHEGVDLYGEPDDNVYAVEDGIVVAYEWFTGENSKPPSPWWNNTEAVLIEGDSGVVVYGEISILPNIKKVGTLVKRGQHIGNLVTVLKKDKGRPMTMLHLELYIKGIRKTGAWDHGLEKPEGLLDPTDYLRKSLIIT
jgi:murein DD-endopeptidase MepM/ murein hydrolase activator NlpD